MMTKLNFFKACALLCAVFSLSSCVKEEIFSYDDEWDNLIKRTKQFTADGVTGSNFSDPLWEDYDWASFPKEYLNSNGDCFIRWVASVRYSKDKNGTSYKIKNRDFYEIVAELLQIPINSIPPRPNLNSPTVNPTPVDYENEKWWNDNYYSKVGNYDNFGPGTIERMQRWALGKGDNEQIFECNYTQKINHDDGSLGYTDFFNQGTITDKNGKILIESGWVNAYVLDQNGNRRPHTMFPVKYDPNTEELLCRDYDNNGKRDNKLVPVNIRDLIQCGCNFKK